MTIPLPLCRTAVAAVASAALFAFLALPAAAADESAGPRPARVLSDTWHFELGGLWANFNSSLQLSKGKVIGTAINLEDDLDLSSDTTTWNLNGSWRFGSASSLGFAYTSFNRDGSNKLDRTFTVGDTVFDVDAKIDTEVDLDFLQLYYRWSAINSGKTEAGFSFGLSTYKISASIAGEGTVTEGGESTFRKQAQEGEDITAPIPVVGLFINYAFTPNLILMADANFFRIDVGDISGSVISSQAKLDYYFTRNIGAGVSVFGNYVRADVSGDTDWTIGLNQNGFGAHLSCVF
ncbi:MAG: hypothetical protein MUF27_00025 [Acidobacteria bacterium]|jgi:hypothetical protein|nr:hypothetical protein [Acidobacteriota bacterium]